MSVETMTKLATYTVGVTPEASISFTNIPQTYTDLVVKLSLRTNEAGGSAQSTTVNMSINGVTTNRNHRAGGTYGGTNTFGETATTGAIGTVPGAAVTSATFNSIDVYFLNYTANDTKIFSVDSASENNSATNNELRLTTGQWAVTNPITSLTFTPGAGSLVQYSTATLYGIRNAKRVAGNSVKATGGNISFDGTYVIHTFNASGTFTPTASLTVDYLVVAGGGGGGGGNSGNGEGGGGAGGMRCTVTGTGGSGSLETPLNVTQGTAYSVTVGGGGAAENKGTNSIFSTITSDGGGTRAAGLLNGGSGAGQSGGGGVGPGTGISTQGFGGGTTTAGTAGGAGGGGASQVGNNATGASGANGGNGRATSISGSSVTYAGGGGGSAQTASGGSGGTGGTGGGGNGAPASGNATNGTTNLGGGGGAARIGAGQTAGQGGSGIVIIRYKA